MVQTKRMLIAATLAAASCLGGMVAATDARAQATTGGCTFCTGPSVPPTLPTPPVATIPTPPPKIEIPTPPPVVVVTPQPTPPAGMFTNVPSDMRRMTQFDTITSINRLSEPGAINFSIPRQALPNKLENRTDARAYSGMESDRAIRVLESAKPLI